MDGDITEFIGDYRIVRMLGAGGMGEVFLVEHPRLPRQDALKLLDTHVSRNQEFHARFKREADLLAPLRHPNVITVYDRGEHQGRLWLTMEYIAGTDVAKMLRERGPLPLDLAVPIIAGAGAALDYAYAEHRITHRDVKPANILVEFGQGGRLKVVKLADFGIAKAAGESTSLTSTGVTIGTMSYISPEAAQGTSELDNRADIYSLGCTAFELLTGTVPYTAGTVTAVLMAHIYQTIPSISRRNPRLPARLDAVFEKVLAKEPDDRFQSCEEFLSALDGVSTSDTSVRSQASPWADASSASAPTTPAHTAWTIAAPPVPQSTKTGSSALKIWGLLGVVLLGIILVPILMDLANQNKAVSTPTSAHTPYSPSYTATTTPPYAKSTTTSPYTTTSTTTTTWSSAPRTSAAQPHWDGPWIRNYWEDPGDCNNGLNYWVVQPGTESGMYALKRGCLPNSWKTEITNHCRSYDLPAGQCALWDQDSILSEYRKHGDLLVVAITQACLDRAGLSDFHEGPIHKDCVVAAQ